MAKRTYETEADALAVISQAAVDPTGKLVTPQGAGLSLREAGAFDYLRSKHGWRLRAGIRGETAR